MYFHCRREIPYTRLQMYLNIIASLDNLLCIRFGGTGEVGMGNGPPPPFLPIHIIKRRETRKNCLRGHLYIT